MRRIATLVILALLLVSSMPLSSPQQPDIVQEHWYHSWTTLTYDTGQWNSNYDEVAILVSAGYTLLGRDMWVMQISDWSTDTKPDGSPKEKVYIDGGHHGNEHLGTELAFLVAEYFIEGWYDEVPEVIEVLQNTEIHVLIMLNADGNDIDTRWNMNQVDLNRNYDHHWSDEETRSGNGPFSEPETRNNAEYMKQYVADADLYVTMHTGTWILAYPWGFTGEIPSDWELYTHIADTIHETIAADLPVRNANAGIYPTHGTSRDYGYGVMGFPTFTFETDDEQFLLGTVQSLSDRLSVELDVMKYLISNVWYWRARLNVTSLEITSDEITLEVENQGHATTLNATLHYLDNDGEVAWHSPANFSVNATNSSIITYPAGDLKLMAGGSWELHYQKRVIDSSQWVTEAIQESVIQEETKAQNGFLPASSIFISLLSAMLAGMVVNRRKIGDFKGISIQACEKSPL